MDIENRYLGNDRSLIAKNSTVTVETRNGEYLIYECEPSEAEEFRRSYDRSLSQNSNASIRGEYPDFRVVELELLATIAGERSKIYLSWNGRNVITDTGETVELPESVKTEQQAREALVAMYSGAQWDFEEIC